MLAATPIQHIDIVLSRAVVTGTDIKVSQVAREFEQQGMSPDEIVEAHPHLSLAAVHSALAFFYDHRKEIEDEWQQSEELIRELRSTYPSQRC